MINYLNITGLIVGVLALAAAIYCFWQIRSLTNLRQAFFQTSDKTNLEEILFRLGEEITKGQKRQDYLETALANLTDKTSYGVQKVGLVRFNPFEDGGGNFSFTLALLDEHNCGVVLTSIHGRQQNRIYTKKITDGKADAQLTEEEEQAIISAHTKFKQKTANDN